MSNSCSLSLIRALIHHIEPFATLKSRRPKRGLASSLSLGLVFVSRLGWAQVSYDKCPVSGINNPQLVDEYSGSFPNTVNHRRDAVVFFRDVHAQASDTFFCSGTLVGDTHILAARHCAQQLRHGHAYFFFDDPADRISTGIFR